MHKFAPFKNFAFFTYFAALGIACFLTIKNAPTITSILQILSVLSILGLLSLRLVFTKLKEPKKTAAAILGITPVAFFVYLLIFSTGSLASPFLILTHFLAIAASFLISAQVGVSFIASTLVLLVISLKVDPNSATYIGQNPTVTLLTFIAYLAIIPFSYILARQYKIKEQWITILEKQVTTSKKGQEELLKNIESPIIVTDSAFKIAYVNDAAEKFTKFTDEIIGLDFFKTFTFKDKEGRDLASYALPLAQTLSSKEPQLIKNIRIQGKDKKFLAIDLKILPALGPEGPLGTICVLESVTPTDTIVPQKPNLSVLSLAKFLTFLNSQKQTLADMTKTTMAPKQTQILVAQNRLLENLAQDFIYALKLESQNLETVSSLFDVQKATEEVYWEEMEFAKQKSQKLQIRDKSPQSLFWPRQNVKILKTKSSVDEIFILGNIPFYKSAIKRILDLVIQLTTPNQTININVQRQGTLVKVTIESPDLKIANAWLDQIFKKFYGRLADNPALSQTTGLEGFIAKSLIEAMGGNVEATKQGKNGTLITLTFGTQKQS